MDQAILIVDDDMQLTSFLSRFLGKHGYKVQTAASGVQARALYSASSTSLIVLDLNLPDVDGFDIAKEIRAQAQTPIIMLSARDEVFDRIVGLELGADDYLTKPYEPRECWRGSRRCYAVWTAALSLRESRPSSARISPGLSLIL